MTTIVESAAAPGAPAQAIGKAGKTKTGGAGAAFAALMKSLAAAAGGLKGEAGQAETKGHKASKENAALIDAGVGSAAPQTAPGDVATNVQVDAAGAPVVMPPAAPDAPAPLVVAQSIAPDAVAGQPESRVESASRNRSQVAPAADQAVPSTEPVEGDATVVAASETTPEAPQRLQPGDATAMLRMLAAGMAGRGETASTPAAGTQPAAPAPVATVRVAMTTPATIGSRPAAENAPAARAADAAQAAVAQFSVTPATASAGREAGHGGSEQRKGREGSAGAAVSATNASATPFAVPVAGDSASFAQPAAAGSSAPDAGIALGQQSLDMHMGGRWIDQLAREVASLSASGGHGSFYLSSEELGDMQVEMTQGANGTDVRLLVDNDAAKSAIEGAGDQLFQDAQLSAVRLGEVRVERVHAAADARGGDMSNGQQGQQSSSSSATMGQQAGNGQRQPSDMSFGQGDGQARGDRAKSSASSAVLQDTARADASARADGLNDRGARYA